MIAICHANIVLEQEIIKNGTLLIENDRIASIGAAEEVHIPADADRYDAKGAFVGPGFVDIHVHGGNGHFFYQSPMEATSHFLFHGETTVLPTLYYNLSKPEFLASIARVQAAMKSEPIGAAIGGFYMEGPYMNPKYGASPEKNKWKGEIRAEDYDEVVELAGTDTKVWAIAPEREGIEPFLAKAKSVNPCVVFAVGHSEATPAQVRRLKKYGLSLQTHCMNATGRPDCAAGTRSAGPDEACLLDREMYAEVICDSQGIHVEPELLRLILAVKGVDHTVLISDSYVSDEPTPPQFSHITDLQFDANGGLCGSKLTLDVACRNMMKHTGCSIGDAFLMASRNPARAIGMDREIGTIEVGKYANLVIVDEAFRVEKVMLRGSFI